MIIKNKTNLVKINRIMYNFYGDCMKLFVTDYDNTLYIDS